ncbi:MAG: hypothetical protein ACRC78_00915, partial [Planktothrix sp.]
AGCDNPVLGFAGVLTQTLNGIGEILYAYSAEFDVLEIIAPILPSIGNWAYRLITSQFTTAWQSGNNVFTNPPTNESFTIEVQALSGGYCNYRRTVSLGNCDTTNLNGLSTTGQSISTQGSISITGVTGLTIGGTYEYSLNGINWGGPLDPSLGFTLAAPGGTYDLYIREYNTDCVSLARGIIPFDCTGFDTQTITVSVVDDTNTNILIGNGSITVTGFITFDINDSHSVSVNNGVNWYNGFTVPNLSGNTYTLLFRHNESGCIVSLPSILVSPPPAPPVITADFDEFVDPIKRTIAINILTGVGPYSYRYVIVNNQNRGWSTPISTPGPTISFDILESHHSVTVEITDEGTGAIVLHTYNTQWCGTVPELFTAPKVGGGYRYYIDFPWEAREHNLNPSLITFTRGIEPQPVLNAIFQSQGIVISTNNGATYNSISALVGKNTVLPDGVQYAHYGGSDGINNTTPYCAKNVLADGDKAGFILDYMAEGIEAASTIPGQMSVSVLSKSPSPFQYRLWDSVTTTYLGPYQASNLFTGIVAGRRYRLYIKVIDGSPSGIQFYAGAVTGL